MRSLAAIIVILVAGTSPAAERVIFLLSTHQPQLAEAPAGLCDRLTRLGRGNGNGNGNVGSFNGNANHGNNNGNRNFGSGNGNATDGDNIGNGSVGSVFIPC